MSCFPNLQWHANVDRMELGPRFFPFFWACVCFSPSLSLAPSFFSISLSPSRRPLGGSPWIWITNNNRWCGTRSHPHTRTLLKCVCVGEQPRSCDSHFQIIHKTCTRQTGDFDLRASKAPQNHTRFSRVQNQSQGQFNAKLSHWLFVSQWGYCDNIGHESSAFLFALLGLGARAKIKYHCSGEGSR